MRGRHQLKKIVLAFQSFLLEHSRLVGGATQYEEGGGGVQYESYSMMEVAPTFFLPVNAAVLLPEFPSFMILPTQPPLEPAHRIEL